MHAHDTSRSRLTDRVRPLTLAGLRGFEAAARHQSLTRAAEELHLTQSAVSRQVQGLEDELGFALFVRRAREIVLTPQGRALLPIVQRTLAELDRGVERLRREILSPRITLSTFASFASLWLVPRLARFRAQRPDVDIDIGASDRLVDLEVEDVDLAIRYLRAEAAPADAELLFGDCLFPLAGPRFFEQSPGLRTLDDLSRHALIECRVGGLAEQRSSWRHFLEALGRPGLEGRSQLNFDFIVQALMAAQGDQGVVLARTYGADLMLSGQLRVVLPESVLPQTGCYLILSPRGAQRPDVQAFAAWLREEAATFNARYRGWLATQFFPHARDTAWLDGGSTTAQATPPASRPFASRRKATP